MFYRVDYTLGIWFAGMILGALGGQWAARWGAARIARWYLGAVALGLLLRTVLANAASFAGWAPAGTLSAVDGDLLSVLGGVVLGIGFRFRQPTELLTQRAYYYAICLGSAVTFVSSGFAKARPTSVCPVRRGWRRATGARHF